MNQRASCEGNMCTTVAGNTLRLMRLNDTHNTSQQNRCATCVRLVVSIASDVFISRTRRRDSSDSRVLVVFLSGGFQKHSSPFFCVTCLKNMFGLRGGCRAANQRRRPESSSRQTTRKEEKKEKKQEKKAEKKKEKKE